MVTFTINIPQMLAYIYHTWILWEWCFPNPITMPQPRTRSHWRLYPEMIRSKSQKAAELQQSHDVSKIQQWQTVQFYYWLYRMCIYILYVYNIYICTEVKTRANFILSDLVRVSQCSDPASESHKLITNRKCYKCRNIGYPSKFWEWINIEWTLSHSMVSFFSSFQLTLWKIS